jgi:hypothetical protein
MTLDPREKLRGFILTKPNIEKVDELAVALFGEKMARVAKSVVINRLLAAARVVDGKLVADERAQEG